MNYVLNIKFAYDADEQELINLMNERGMIMSEDHVELKGTIDIAVSTNFKTLYFLNPAIEAKYVAVNPAAETKKTAATLSYDFNSDSPWSVFYSL